MKLLEIVIRNIRGVVELHLVPDGKTCVIVGANGTGKSAIVDAIDFLLTGDMGRFAGRSGFKLKEHGKHLNAEPKECFVEGRVRLPGFKDDVRLCRRFANLAALEVNPEVARDALQPFLTVAEQRQYILTRENMLRFVLAQPRDRATQVQSLLNLQRLEPIRQALTTARNSAEQALKSRVAAIRSAEGTCAATLALPAWDEGAALKAANKHRAILGAAEVAALSDAKKEVGPPVALAGAKEPNASGGPASSLADVATVGKSVIDVTVADVDANDGVLLTEIAELTGNPERLRAARQLELVELGIELIDGGEQCPLCDTAWEAGTLRAYLEDKRGGGRAIKPAWERMAVATRALTQWLADTESLLNRIFQAGPEVERGTDPKPLLQYSNQLAALRKALIDPLSLYAGFRRAGCTLSEQLGVSEARDVLRSLYAERRAAAAKSPEQAAWDTLTRFCENLIALDKERARVEKDRQSFVRMEALHRAFISARDATLDSVYESVGTRFAELYRQLHAPDENSFTASMMPTDTGLTFSVGFRGVTHAMPHTLHSEGHQDSMGLCLFLALAEKMQGDRLEFCLLDDVVMAIDAGHRRQIGRLLKALQTTTQFVIATHDVTWAQQLKTEKCVTASTTTRFIGWSLDGGPIEGVLEDFITESRTALAGGNVRDAAAALRHGLESFFHLVADSLAARVPYSLAGQYELGDLQSACNARLRELIKAAKSASQSWGQKDREELCTKLDEERGHVVQLAQIEQWAINPNVHFNVWMNQTPSEFAEVLGAFERLSNLFRCASCQSLLRVVFDGAAEKALTCDAACQPLNLQKK